MKSIILFIIVLLIVTGLKVKSCATIDSCLDKGGSFNYEACECDFKSNHKSAEINLCI